MLGFATNAAARQDAVQRELRMVAARCNAAATDHIPQCSRDIV